MIILKENRIFTETAGIQKGIGAKGLLPILSRLNGRKTVYQLIFGKSGSHLDNIGQNIEPMLRISSGHIKIDNLRVEFNDIASGDIKTDDMGTITNITLYIKTGAILMLSFI